MSDVKVLHLEDGRACEQHTTHSADGRERVVEYYAEEARPKKLEKRVIEKTKDIIYERQIETIDPSTGQVVDVKVESTDPIVKTELREHIALADKSVGSSNYVTKQELQDVVVSSVSAAVEGIVQQLGTTKPTFSAQSFMGNSSKMSAQSVLNERLAQVSNNGSSQWDRMDMLLFAGLIITVGFFVYRFLLV